MRMCRKCKVILKPCVLICPKCGRGIIPNNEITDWYAQQLIKVEGFKSIQCDALGRS